MPIEPQGRAAAPLALGLGAIIGAVAAWALWRDAGRDAPVRGS